MVIMFIFLILSASLVIGTAIYLNYKKNNRTINQTSKLILKEKQHKKAKKNY